MIRVSAVFSDAEGDVGATETYLLASPNNVATWIGNPPGVTGSPAADFVSKRRECLPYGNANGSGGYAISKLRASLVQAGSFRTTAVYNVPLALGRGRWGQVDKINGTEPWTRLLVDLNPGVGPHGRLFFFGIPQDQVKEAFRFRPAAAWYAVGGGVVKEFFDAMKAQGWTIARRPAQNAAAAPLPITSFTVSADAFSATLQPALIAAGGGAPPTTGQVVIRGRHFSEWNGVHRYRYDAVGGTLVLGPARQRLADWPGAVQSGTVQLMTADNNQAVQSWDALRLVKRDTGDPFVPYRGRRRRSQA